jgi:hypothetical protein
MNKNVKYIDILEHIRLGEFGKNDFTPMNEMLIHHIVTLEIRIKELESVKEND